MVNFVFVFPSIFHFFFANSQKYSKIVIVYITSSYQTVKSGVPQGSVLGPVLYLLFINDVPLLTEDYDLDIFADDTTAHTTHKDAAVVKNRLQTGTNGFKCWCLCNKMHIHLKKTCHMLLGSRRNLLRTDPLEIFLDNELNSKREETKTPRCNY